MVHVYTCTITYTNILSAFYEAWKNHRDGDVYFEIGEASNIRLFSTYHEFTESYLKVQAIESMIRKNLGEPTLYAFSLALLSNDPQRADSVFRVMQVARNVPNQHLIMEHLGNKDVQHVFELKRQVGREAHLLQGFIRFRELDHGVLFAEIRPKSQVLTCFADFFQNRYPLENWIIFDHTHNVALVHPKSSSYFLITFAENELDTLIRPDQTLDQYEDLWRIFFQSVSIKERENKDLQRNLLPLRFREHMIEFHS